MPRAEVRFVGVTIKRNTSNMHTRLIEFGSDKELASLVAKELNTWGYNLEEEVNQFNIKVQLEGGRQINVKAKVAVTVELEEDDVLKLTTPIKKTKKRKPFVIEFGGEMHQYLCEARASSNGTFNRNNMKVSRLKVEGYLTNNNVPTPKTLELLDEFEAIPIEDIEDWVCVHLLFITKSSTVETHERDYLEKHGLVHETQAYSWGSTKLSVTHTAAVWLCQNVVRIMKDHPQYGNLLVEALKYYPYEELAEPLANTSSWVRDAAKLRADILKRELAGAKMSSIETQIRDHWEMKRELTDDDIKFIKRELAGAKMSSIETRIRDHWEMKRELTDDDIKFIKSLVKQFQASGDQDAVQNAVHAYATEVEDLL